MAEEWIGTSSLFSCHQRDCLSNLRIHQDVIKQTGFRKLNQVLAKAGFDAFVENLCGLYYVMKSGRPSVPAGVYFRMSFIGYVEGLNSQRGTTILPGICGQLTPSTIPAPLSPFLPGAKAGARKRGQQKGSV
jgi:hypothetical protein